MEFVSIIESKIPFFKDVFWRNISQIFGTIRTKIFDYTNIIQILEMATNK